MCELPLCNMFLLHVIRKCVVEVQSFNKRSSEVSVSAASGSSAASSSRCACYFGALANWLVCTSCLASNAGAAEVAIHMLFVFRGDCMPEKSGALVGCVSPLVSAAPFFLQRQQWTPTRICQLFSWIFVPPVQERAVAQGTLFLISATAWPWNSAPDRSGSIVQFTVHQHISSVRTWCLSFLCEAWASF